jgi:hypothetical protein
MTDQFSFDDENVIVDQKIKALDELFADATLYSNSVNFLELLDFINRFPSLSPFNAFLIYNQNPGAAVVLSAKKWRSFGHKVKPHTRPLVILVPFGPVAFVYDIADTDGPYTPEELINPFLTKGKLSISIYERTLHNATTAQIKVVYNNLDSNSAGYVRRLTDKFEITLNDRWDLNVKYSTLIHEIGHVLCGHIQPLITSWWRDRSELTEEISEIEAESVSYLVCSRIGLETISYKYLSNYIKKNERIPMISLDTILTVSGYIEQMSSDKFKPKKLREIIK